MEHKPIYLDGVDVSGCEYACNTSSGKNGCKHPMMKNIYCFKNPNCYFKQLQKEKIENLNNRQIIESAENLIYENSELYKNLKEKEQEYEELKFSMELLSFKYKKCNSVLEEIEEYCNKQISLTEDLPFRTTESDILDIINKVKDG